MGFYDNRILPHIINCACSSPPILKLRKRLVPKCKGQVLEIGMGSGINLSYYDPQRAHLIWGLEPSEGMRKKAQKNIEKSPIDVKWLDLPGEKIPLPDNSVDTVLLTYTLCTIPDWQQALNQMRRVLKPDGKLLFCEHGKAPDKQILGWQNRVNPYWKKIAGGCNLNRPISKCIEESNFEITALEAFYAPKTPKFAGYTYFGEAIIKSH